MYFRFGDGVYQLLQGRKKSEAHECLWFLGSFNQGQVTLLPAGGRLGSLGEISESFNASGCKLGELLGSGLCEFK